MVSKLNSNKIRTWWGSNPSPHSYKHGILSLKLLPLAKNSLYGSILLISYSVTRSPQVTAYKKHLRISLIWVHPRIPFTLIHVLYYTTELRLLHQPYPHSTTSTYNHISSLNSFKLIQLHSCVFIYGNNSVQFKMKFKRESKVLMSLKEASFTKRCDYLHPLNKKEGVNRENKHIYQTKS